MKLPRDFYNRKTLKVARDLLGKFIVRNYRGRKICGMITETEAYAGEDDLASHASRGRTPRTRVMFGPPGFAYVYLVYGMHCMFNIVTEKEGYPAAVLIRGIEKCQGPGRMSKYLKITKSQNNIDLTGNELWLEDRGLEIRSSQIKKAPRVGIDYAGHCREWQWRFILDGVAF